MVGGICFSLALPLPHLGWSDSLAPCLPAFSSPPPQLQSPTPASFSSQAALPAGMAWSRPRRGREHFSSFESRLGWTAFRSEMRLRKTRNPRAKSKTIIETGQETAVCWLGETEGQREVKRGNSHHYVTLAAKSFFRAPVSVLIYLSSLWGNFTHLKHICYLVIWVTKYSFHVANSVCSVTWCIN